MRYCIHEVTLGIPYVIMNHFIRFVESKIYTFELFLHFGGRNVY